nr:hypothetical protein [Dehalococcoidales bacterium]
MNKVMIFKAGEPRDDKFYQYIGPFALNRAVTKELHDPQYGAIYDEPYGTWFVMTDQQENVIGLCAMFEKRSEE